MPGWTKLIEDADEFLGFQRWAADKDPECKKKMTRYLMLKVTLEDKQTPIPAPLQCRQQGDRIAECLVTLFRSDSRDKLGKRSKALMSVINKEIPLNARGIGDFQGARRIIEQNQYTMEDFDSELDKTMDDIGKEIETVFSKSYAKQLACIKAYESYIPITSELLKGKKEGLNYYLYQIKYKREKKWLLVLRNTPDKALFDGCIKARSGTILRKGTNALTRNKYFRFDGDASTEEMFEALQNTTWNMSNLRDHTDLEKI